jgi:topoisomerase-4 subunit A
LATKILPHNFIELLDASIAVLKNPPVNLLPDFPTGGMADASAYNEGQRGGRVRVRAKIMWSAIKRRWPLPRSLLPPLQAV